MRHAALGEELSAPIYNSRTSPPPSLVAGALAGWEIVQEKGSAVLDPWPSWRSNRTEN
jgi:hypothetical protein